MDHPHRYTVWKRFYYQVTRFAAGVAGANRARTLPEVGAFDFTNAAAEIEARRHNIEMVAQAPTQAVITRRANVLDSNQRALLEAAGREGYNAVREPVSLKIVLVNQILTPREELITYGNLVTSSVAERDVPHVLWVDESKNRDEDWLISADWCWQSGDSLWNTLDRAERRVVGESRIAITIPALPARTLSTDWWVSVRIRYRARGGGASPGLSLDNTIRLTTTSMGRQAAGGPTAPVVEPQATRDLIAIHELGHALNMVSMQQDTHYVGHRHSGPHCATGLSDDQRREPSYFGQPGTCVMFGGPSTVQVAQFCAACDVSMRARAVTGMRMT